MPARVCHGRVPVIAYLQLMREGRGGRGEEERESGRARADFEVSARARANKAIYACWHAPQVTILLPDASKAGAHASRGTQRREHRHYQIYNHREGGAYSAARVEHPPEPVGDQSQPSLIPRPVLPEDDSEDATAREALVGGHDRAAAVEAVGEGNPAAVSR